MSTQIEKYDPNTDAWANRELFINYGERFMKDQVLSTEKKYLDKVREEEYFNSNRRQLVIGLGLKNPLFWTTFVGFTYLGGLFHARRQFINGGDYFFNSKFDFIGGKRPIFVGMLLGVAVGSLLFGQAHLVEDYLKCKYRKLRRQPVDEKDVNLLLKEGLPDFCQTLGNSIYDN